MARRISQILRIVALCIVFLRAVDAGAQPQYPYSVDTKPSRGLMPTSEQMSGSLDSIDPISGKLHIQIPLASLPQGNAGSGFDLALVYDSHLYDLDPGEVALGRISQHVSSVLTGGGWHYNFMHYSVEAERRYIPSWEQGVCSGTVPYVGEHERIYRYRLSLPDGSQHILHLLGYGDEVGDGYYGDGFYAVDMRGIRSNCAQSNPGRYPSNANGTLTYFTTDGSYLRLQVDTSSTNPQWTLFYPDGHRVVGRLDQADHIYDANGNGVHVSRGTENGHTVAYLTDDFGRSIRIEFSLTSSSIEKEDKITTTGPNGPLEWRVKWQRIQTGTQGQTYLCYEDDSLVPPYTFSCPANFQIWVVRYVQLPLAAPSFTPPPANPWSNFEFTYSGAGQGYGRLLTMRVPSGAQYAYCCDVYNPGFRAESVAYAGYRLRTVTHDGVSDVWTYQKIDRTAIRVTNPDGGQIQYHFYDPLIASEYWSRNLVYWIEEPGGTVRKRQWTRNRVFSLRGAVNIDPNNPYIERESVTVDKVAGQPRTAVTDTLLDKNGNPLQTREYGWSSTVEGQTMESPGVPLRITDRVYHASVPSSTDTSNGTNRYWNAAAPLRLNATLSQTVRDGLSAVKAITEFEYDDPLTKGNIKYRRHWDDEKGGCSASTPLSLACPAQHREYDSTGNLIDVFEPEIRTHVTYSGPYPSLVEYAPGTASARSFSYSWNTESGVLTSQTDVQNGTVTTYGYDAYGRQVLIDEAGLRQAETTYDDENRTVLLKRDLRAHGDGSLQTLSHTDQLGRVDLIRSSDGLPLSPSGTDGIKVRSTYHTFPGGTITVTSTPYRSTSDPTLEWTCTQKDEGGRAVAASVFNGGVEPSDCQSQVNRVALTVTDYHSAAGPPRTRVIDPAGRTVDRYADALGRLAGVVEDPDGFAYSTTYEYDALGNLLRAIQSDESVTQLRTFSYTSLGRLKTTTNPESGSLQFTYRDSGELLTRQDDRGFSTTFSYDDLHRVVGKTYSNDGDVTPDVTYVYHDAAPCSGQLQSVSSATGTTSYGSCDPLGRISRHTQSIAGGGSFNFNYTYWLTGSLRSMQYPSGKLVNFDVDDAGRGSKVYSQNKVYADLGSGASYTADGRVAKLKLGNNLWETRDYQTPGTPTALKLGTSENPSEQLELQYNYSATADNGNLLSHVIRRGSTSWAQTYDYDALNRLTCATETVSATPVGSCSPENSWRQMFGYDRFGNRWVSSSTGFSLDDIHEFSAGTFIDRSTNRLNGSSYDAAGNLTAYTPWSLSYDAESRLLGATSASNGSSWFTYDGDGRRIKKVTATPSLQTTLYVYDAAGHLAAEYSTQTSTPGTAYLFTDLLGTPRAITRDDGTVVECSDYSPFGRLLQTPTRSLPCHHLPNVASQQFTGKQRDRETSLDWFTSRYYSAAQGRFTSADRLLGREQWLAEPQRWNRYAYALNNPTRYIDPDGRDAIAAFFLGEQARDVSTLEVIFSKETVTEIKAAAGQFFAEHRALTQGWSPVPTTKSELGFQAIIPAFGKMAGPVLQKVAGPVVKKAVGTAASEAPVIIGETMKRVKEVAEKIPGATYLSNMPDFARMGKTSEQVTSAMMEYNRKWLLEEIRSGRKIIDIGLDHSREIRSIFYEMEQAMLKNYKKLYPEFDNVIKP